MGRPLLQALGADVLGVDVLSLNARYPEKAAAVRDVDALLPENSPRARRGGRLKIARDIAPEDPFLLQRRPTRSRSRQLRAHRLLRPRCQPAKG
jgi:hypothetical protein